MCWRLLGCENVFPLVNLTFKWSNTRQFSPRLFLFKASAVRHGPQQPTGSEPCSFSTRLQQFWGGDSPGTPSDTSYDRPATLFIQLYWRLWPSALGRSAAQNPAPQYWFLHGMKKRTLYVCLCWISSFWLVVHCYLCQIKLRVFTRRIFRCTLLWVMDSSTFFPCSYRSERLANWRKTVTNSCQVIVRDRLILPLTSTSCCPDFTNTCLPIATSIPALRYIAQSATRDFTQSSVVGLQLFWDYEGMVTISKYHGIQYHTAIIIINNTISSYNCP